VGRKPRLGTKGTSLSYASTGGATRANGGPERYHGPKPKGVYTKGPGSRGRGMTMKSKMR
jgi:hypothetical protein